MTEPRHTVNTITSDQLDALYRRIETLEHVAAGNKRHVQLIVPDLQRAEAAIARVVALTEEHPAGIDTALIHAALDPGQGQPPVNPPGGTSEQLPANVLALLPIRPYLSTACETGAAVHRDERPWLLAHAEDLHDRCRLNHKFTGQPCACTCHP